MTAHKRACAKYYSNNKEKFVIYKRLYRLEEKILNWLNDWNTDYFKTPKPKPKKK